jgi:hypothetical protein
MTRREPWKKVPGRQFMTQPSSGRTTTRQYQYKLAKLDDPLLTSK